ncbi:CCA tRNA nucleotidyltransferase [Bdellovibrionota bacterium FG-1]
MDEPLKWIRTERPFSLPVWVREAIQRLNDAGYVAFVVGGSVRDFLLGRESKDHDIATSANPDDICRLFPQAVTVGKAFGVIKVPVQVQGDRSPVLLEIATFREDLDYQDHRHPVGVRFSGPEEDAKRRDFTINAMFFDPKMSRILDTVGGIEDLRAGVIRAIGDPSVRFREDALRLLRAVRFSSCLGLTIEPHTQEAISARARLLVKVSEERVHAELTLIWNGPRPSEALQALSTLGLLCWVLPEVEALKGVTSQEQPWGRTLRVLEVLAHRYPQRSDSLSWAAVLLEVPRSGSGAADVARTICERMKMSRHEIERVCFLIEEEGKFKEAFKMREATLQRFIRQSGFDELLALHRVVATVTDGNLAFFEFCSSRWQEIQKEGSETLKLLAGDDLIQLGLKPGPGFSEILRVIEDLSLENKLHSKEEALEYVVKHFVK